MKAAIWVAVWGVFLAIGVFRLDPDFGWHVKMGEYIEKYGIPAKDPFTYTMPNFDYIDHAWLTSVLMGWGYRVMGKAGLAAVFATMTMGVLGLAVGGRKRWATVPVLLGSILLLGRGGVRPQVIDWLFLAGMVRWYESREAWRKWRWVFPVVMGVWANLHGGFAVGLVVMLAAVGIRSLVERKVNLVDVAVWGLGIVGAGVNPYGVRVWYEVWLTMSDGGLRWSIAEWQPFFVTVEPAFWMLAVFCFMGMWRYRDKVVKWKAGVAVREVREEGGVEAKVIKKLKTLRIFFTDKDGEKVMKFITYFVMEYTGDAPEGWGEETEEAKWVGWEEAKDRLAYANEKKLWMLARGEI